LDLSGSRKNSQPSSATGVGQGQILVSLWLEDGVSMLFDVEVGLHFLGLHSIVLHNIYQMITARAMPTLLIYFKFLSVVRSAMR